MLTVTTKANLWVYCEAKYYWYSVGRYPRLRLVCTVQVVCFFSQRNYHYQADVSYDSTAGCVNGHNFLHVRKTWSLPFFFSFLHSLRNLSKSKIDTHDEEGLLLFGET